MDKRKSVAGPGGCLAEFMQGPRYGLKISMVFVLCGSLIIAGCTTTSPLTGPTGIRGPWSPDKAIRVTLNTGDTFDLNAYHYAEVREPEDFVCGTGWRINESSWERETFRGKITPRTFERRDTTITEAVYNGALEKVNQRYSDFVLSDSEYVRFRTGEFIVVRTTDGPGFYYTQTGVTAGLTVVRTKMIPLDEIVTIEETSISAGKTILAGAGIAAVAYVIALSVLLYSVVAPSW